MRSVFISDEQRKRENREANERDERRFAFRAEHPIKAVREDIAKWADNPYRNRQWAQAIAFAVLVATLIYCLLRCH